MHRTGCLALVTRRHGRAPRRCCGAALRRYREIGELNSNVLMGQVELAMALAFQGDLAAARCGCARTSAEVCEDHGERWALAYALYVLAYAALAERRPGAGAGAAGASSLAIAHTFHDLLGAVLAVELLALVTAVEGDPAEAALLQGAAGRIWPSVGLPLFGSRLLQRAARALRGAGPRAAGRRAVRGAACGRGALLGLDDGGRPGAGRAAGRRALGAVPSPRRLGARTRESPPPPPPRRAGRRRADVTRGWYRVRGVDQRA